MTACEGDGRLEGVFADWAFECGVELVEGGLHPAQSEGPTAMRCW